MKLFNNILKVSLGVLILIPPVNAEVISGNPKGKVTVVEYYDYNCPHCRTMSSVIDSLERDNEVKVSRRVLAMMSPESMFAAKAVLASRKQGNEKYERFNQLLMLHKRFINRQIVMRTAENAGLDIDLLARHMENPAIEAEVRANMVDAHAQGIHLVPTTMVMRSGDSRSAQKFIGKTSIFRIKSAISDLS